MRADVGDDASFRLILTFLVLMVSAAGAQDFVLRGQLSGWVIGNQDEVVSAVGSRYQPELFAEMTMGEQLYLDANLALNAFTTARVQDFAFDESKSDIKPYRLWARLSADQWELRIGLQKINFGSAMLLRALQWFDRVDPRDPLQLTDGVYGLLGRYYFQNNTNVWLWALYGDDETKGQEITPSREGSIEAGGRVQFPLFSGEAGLTIHHRQADFSTFAMPGSTSGRRSDPEVRFAVDGKWDVGVGLWTEAVVTRHQSNLPGFSFQETVSLGIDYTFTLGNGLSVVGEQLISQFSNRFLSAEQRVSLSGFSINYPLSIIDNLTAITYVDWEQTDIYRTLLWRRTFDSWSFYAVGFWNPENRLLGSSPGDAGSAFRGKGLQLMVNINH